MSDLMDDVRATSDALLADTERLHALELEKRSVDPRSTRFEDLSLRIEDLGARVASLSSIEREIAETTDEGDRR